MQCALLRLSLNTSKIEIVLEMQCALLRLSLNTSKIETDLEMQCALLRQSTQATKIEPVMGCSVFSCDSAPKTSQIDKMQCSIVTVLP